MINGAVPAVTLTLFPLSVRCRGGGSGGGARSPKRGIDIGMEDLEEEDAELTGCDIIVRCILEGFRSLTYILLRGNADTGCRRRL